MASVGLYIRIFCAQSSKIFLNWARDSTWDGTAFEVHFCHEKVFFFRFNSGSFPSVAECPGGIEGKNPPGTVQEKLP